MNHHGKQINYVYFLMLYKSKDKDSTYITQTDIPHHWREARWPSGRASDSGARGRGFDPHPGHRVVSLSKIHLPPKKYW